MRDESEAQPKLETASTLRLARTGRVPCIPALAHVKLCFAQNSRYGTATKYSTYSEPRYLDRYTDFRWVGTYRIAGPAASETLAAGFFGGGAPSSP